MHILRPLTEKEMAALKYETFRQSHAIITRRMLTILKISENRYSRKEIAEFLGIDVGTVTDHVLLFNEGGIKSLKTIKNGTQRISELDGYTDIILSDFEEKPPRSAIEAQQRIKELTGLERGLTQIRAFMKRHGMQYRMAGQIPAKADTQAQKEFDFLR